MTSEKLDTLWIEWIKALKSETSINNTPLYPATGVLKKKNLCRAADGYCCLGVLCLISEELEMNLVDEGWMRLKQVSPYENKRLFYAMNNKFLDRNEEIMNLNDSLYKWPIDYLIEEVAPDHLKETLRLIKYGDVNIK